MKNVSVNKQSGAVSLFMVIFSMLIITVVTVSFIRLMMNDQMQASNNDLSQSAYDSALAGVEDAKRVLLKYQKDCKDDPDNCSFYASRISGPGVECNEAMEGISGNGSTDEIRVQQSQSGNDVKLDQAYTCVKIELNTVDYIGNLSAGQSQLVPLISTAPFDKVRLEWFSKEDLSTDNTALSLEGVNPNGQPLYTAGNWPVNRPPLLRTQLFQVANSFRLTDFDSVSGGRSNGATVFLYPTSQQNIGERAFTDYDFRSSGPGDEADPKSNLNTPLPISCVTNLGAGGYACSAILVLPTAIGGAANNSDRTAFLRLMPLYNAAHFRVTLWNGPVNVNNPPADPVKFKDVQPAVDSTGRANDLFRRVVSRVDLFDTTFPYPDGIEVTGNFCKDFAVTPTDYIPNTNACAP